MLRIFDTYSIVGQGTVVKLLHYRRTRISQMQKLTSITSSIYKISYLKVFSRF